MNRKMLVRLIHSEKERIREAVTKEADDGTSAIEEMENDTKSGGVFDFVLMDFIMVTPLSFLSILMHLDYLCS